EERRDFFRAAFSGIAGCFNFFQPRREILMLAERAKKTADLFSPLAETSPNQFLSPRAERMRFLETDQVEKRRIDIGFRVETPPGDPMTAGDPVGGSKEDGDGAKRFASWLRRKSVDGFLLEHQHHFFRQRSGE